MCTSFENKVSWSAAQKKKLLVSSPRQHFSFTFTTVQCVFGLYQSKVLVLVFGYGTTAALFLVLARLVHKQAQFLPHRVWVRMNRA